MAESMTKVRTTAVDLSGVHSEPHPGASPGLDAEFSNNDHHRTCGNKICCRHFELVYKHASSHTHEDHGKLYLVCWLWLFTYKLLLYLPVKIEATREVVAATEILNIGNICFDVCV